MPDLEMTDTPQMVGLELDETDALMIFTIDTAVMPKSLAEMLAEFGYAYVLEHYAREQIKVIAPEDRVLN